MRLNVEAFRPSKGQRRTWKANQDLRVEHHPLEFTQEAFDLYRLYQYHWHKTEELPELWEFQEFLLESPIPTEMVHYYEGDLLIGLGWIDVLPDLLSSVYFVFHPDYRSRRLGVYSIMHEIETCQKLGKKWLYLGYWVEKSSKMNYKADYRPCEVLIGKNWVPLESLNSSSIIA